MLRSTPVSRSLVLAIAVVLAVAALSRGIRRASAEPGPASATAVGTPAETAPGPGPGPGSIVPIETGSFGCPMHPDVRSPVPGTCPVCGMDLVPMGPPGGAPYRVDLETTPAVVRPGAAIHLRFRLKHPTSGAIVTDLQIVHEKPFHLFVVSDDLEIYQHIHPVLQDGAVFDVESVLPRAGLYHVYCDFLPVGGTPQVAHLTLATAGYRAPRRRRAVRWAADASLEKVVDGIRFRLALEPPVPAAGLPLALQYHLEDAGTGAPISDLEPYLGAWGHTLVLAADASDFVHSHPARLIPPGADHATVRGGPDVAFNARVAKPGIHRLWSQFQRSGKITTVSFTLDVSSLVRLMTWDGGRWASGDDGAALGDIDGAVRAIAVQGSGLVVGGEFARAGAASANRIARWNGRAWATLGRGVNATVRAIAVAGADVYAGGDFTEAGGAPAAHVARWDGRRWWPLGDGVSGCRDEFCAPTVNAIAIGPDGAVIVGGRFARAGAGDAAGIARWDGKAWKPLGEGVRTGDRDGEVLALVLGGGRVYAGGRFSSAGEARARSIANWDGARWSALGDGISGGQEKVGALGFAGGILYAGGDFTRAGTVNADRAARWDGASWSSLGLRTREPVEAIAASARGRGVGGVAGIVGVVLGGGAFTLGDGRTTQGVVRWDGKKWSALGPGIGGGAFLAPLQALAIDDNGHITAGGGPFIVRVK